MKITIDLVKISKKKLTINQYLLLLKIYYLTKETTLDFTELKADYLLLRDSGFLDINGSDIKLTDKAINYLDSSKYRDYDELADALRQLYPPGLKGGKWAWRATIRDLSNRLEKLDKHFDMEKYSNDDIINATKAYLRSFRSIIDMDKGMQICKYFIEKDGTSTLMEVLEIQNTPVEKLSVSSGFIKKI